MSINYAETYMQTTPESAELGDYHDSGFIDEQTSADFRDMVELLEGAEPSCYPLVQDCWYTQYNCVQGRAYFEEGITESRSYHPKTERDARYMRKAWLYANK